MEKMMEKSMEKETEKKDAAVVQLGKRHVRSQSGFEFDECSLVYEDITVPISALFATDKGMFKLIMRDHTKVRLYRKHDTWPDRETGELIEGDVLWVTDGKYSCRAGVKEGDKSLFRLFAEYIPLEK